MPSRASSTFLRGSDEFTRVLTFSDGLFAISMTLLVVGIGIPDLGGQGEDERALLEALNDLLHEIVSFVISFAVHRPLLAGATSDLSPAGRPGLGAGRMEPAVPGLHRLPALFPPGCWAAAWRTPSRWRSTARLPGS